MCCSSWPTPRHSAPGLDYAQHGWWTERHEPKGWRCMRCHPPDPPGARSGGDRRLIRVPAHHGCTAIASFVAHRVCPVPVRRQRRCRRLDYHNVQTPTRCRAKPVLISRSVFSASRPSSSGGARSPRPTAGHMPWPSPRGLPGEAPPWRRHRPWSIAGRLAGLSGSKAVARRFSNRWSASSRAVPLAAGYATPSGCTRFLPV
jgi:hypothetical protein